MLIDDIVARIDEGGPKSYYSFETFVLNLLKHHLSLQGKSIEPTSDRSFPGDAVAPEGIDDIEGPVLFEIKFNPPRDTKVFKDIWASNIFNYLNHAPP
jgi:hypothetical protein